MIHDRNPQFNLILDGTQYRPMTEDDKQAPLSDVGHWILKQHHYVARAHAQGLIVTTVDPMLAGWEKVDEHVSIFKRW